MWIETICILRIAVKIDRNIEEFTTFPPMPAGSRENPLSGRINHFSGREDVTIMKNIRFLANCQFSIFYA